MKIAGMYSWFVAIAFIGWPVVTLCQALFIDKNNISANKTM